MKLKDIEVGQRYAVGTERSAYEAEVVQVRVYGLVWQGYSHTQSYYPNWVKVRRISDGSAETVQPQQIIGPYPEWEERDLKRRAERSLKRAQKMVAEAGRRAAPELIQMLEVCLEFVGLHHPDGAPCKAWPEWWNHDEEVGDESNVRHLRREIEALINRAKGRTP